ncbi:sigma 54-interacting transcriptional regulator [Tunturiibacter lichenicola]|uniref:sigma 54-interacting transcriptional regulator n=1 Tax=Tunturiibacter lichenicola TaxID=2051959 RepID=UPI003D9BA8D7
MTTLPLETPFSQDAPSPGAAAVATRVSFGTDPSANEAFLAVAQSLSHTGSFGWSVASGELDWSAETFNIFEHDRAIKPTLEMILSRIHPDDRDLVQQTLDRVIETKDDFDLEHRLLMPDGSVKHLHVLARALATPSGNLEFVGAVTDVTKQVQTETTLEKALQEIKRRNEALRASEHNLDLIINTIPALAWSARPDGSAEFFNQHYLEYVGLSAEQVKDWGWTVAVHPDDLNGLAGSWRSIMASGERGESEARLRRFDGEYRWFLFRANPLRNESGNIVKWFGINTDIEDRERAEEKLRRSEAYLLEAQRISQTGSWKLDLASGTVTASPQMFRTYGVEPDEDKSIFELWFSRSHPEDQKRMLELFERSKIQKTSYAADYRIVLPDGAIKHIHTTGHPVLNELGDVVEFVGTNIDITERKQAEEKNRQDEHELRRITDAIPHIIVVLNTDGRPIYVNRVGLEYTGLSVEEMQAEGSPYRVIHPDDIERFREVRHHAILNGVPFGGEQRILGKDGKYRWYLLRYNPFRDEQGHLVRWYATGTDIEDRKVAERHLQNENVALREEIDHFSMFEEIVGSCEPMRQVLKQVAKVAPSNSTVLILGETGTGKELIARALHRRSNRATRAFVRVNCAAIPQSLIASELFGHEKGAFTGALQRRVGRFESADGGTLFLDEIGDLPMDTQVALLRVLQEREFERVGSNHPISVDVRLIAATNADLPAAVAAGTFRRDLFYRLNVVPLVAPPLRERTADIPLLVEYFLGRYAKAAGKTILHICRQTLARLTAYNWPGNIRELQNVVERAVILSETDTFFVDESWLKLESPESRQPREGISTLSDREVELIEAALAECHGRISGPSGAAAKLGIPRQTLESKIRRFRINKYGERQTF